RSRRRRDTCCRGRGGDWTLAAAARDGTPAAARSATGHLLPRSATGHLLPRSATSHLPVSSLPSQPAGIVRTCAPGRCTTPHVVVVDTSPVPSPQVAVTRRAPDSHGRGWHPAGRDRARRIRPLPADPVQRSPGPGG